MEPVLPPIFSGRRGTLGVVDLGRLPYADAYHRQESEVGRALERRGAGDPRLGTLLLVEHEPVITVSRRPTAIANLTATPATLTAAGVAVAQTDRGGDITYHGPGQLVVYPILDLNRLELRLHDYMRLLEEAVITTLADFNLAGSREPGATGVWVAGRHETRDFRRESEADSATQVSRLAPRVSTSKIAAMGVRVRQWISMHGLALNVTTTLAHFDLIIPCGLAGRTVTSLQQQLGPACPPMQTVKATLARHLAAQLLDRV